MHTLIVVRETMSLITFLTSIVLGLYLAFQIFFRYIHRIGFEIIWKVKVENGFHVVTTSNLCETHGKPCIYFS